MSPEFPFTSSEAKRNWMRETFIPGLDPAISRRSAMKALREQGLGYRWTDFLQDVRTVRHLGIHQEGIEALSPGELVPKGRMSQRPARALTQNVQYRFRLQILDLDTGETDWRYKAIASNRHYTKQDAEGAMWEWCETPNPDSDYIVTTVDLYEVWVRDTDKLEYIY